MKKILYFDMDNVLVNFQSGIDRLETVDLINYEGKLDEVPGIFGLMDPVDGAIEAYHKLNEVYDCYILSTAPWENDTAWSDKIKWVRKHLGEVAYKRLILTHNKNLNKGDYLIDDRTKNGAGEFEGEHIHFLTEQFPNWDSVLKYLIK
jgi:5'(3')-deoxyribonucleotidase